MSEIPQESGSFASHLVVQSKALVDFLHNLREATAYKIMLDIVRYISYSFDIGTNMSDGPHKSLPMRRGWKCVAERADKSAFEGSEVQEGINSALQRDCEIEMTNDFLTRLTDACNGQAVSLFGNALGIELEGLRPLAGSGIGRVRLGIRDPDV